jgi:hypothetical protein
MASQGERRFHGTEYNCNSARNGPLGHFGISEYIGYAGCYDLDNNGSLETK